MALTEDDTYRKCVLPKLYRAGWNDDQITEQKAFTDRYQRFTLQPPSQAMAELCVPRGF